MGFIHGKGFQIVLRPGLGLRTVCIWFHDGFLLFVVNLIGFRPPEGEIASAKPAENKSSRQ